MTMKLRIATIALASLGAATLLSYAVAEQALKIDFSDETVGAEPKSFVGVVGVWRIESDGATRCWWRWSAMEAGQTRPASPTRRALYGDRYAEFLTGCRPTPISTPSPDVADFRNGEISVRFEGISGGSTRAPASRSTQDQRRLSDGAGEPAREQSGALKFEKGCRSVKWIRDTPTATRQRHDSRCGSPGPRSRPG
jgi:hypothetical protein